MNIKLNNKPNQEMTKLSLNIRNEISAMAFLLPSILLFAFFKYYPIISGIFVSFFAIDIVNLPGTFVGFTNYIRAFTDVRFYMAMLNNVKMFVYSIAFSFWEPIVIAILINEMRKSKVFFRLMYFIPAVAPGIAMAVLWKYFWQPDFGLANYIIGIFGAKPQMWLNSKEWVYFCMSFPGLVICGGMNMVIYLAALQDVPQEHYEAALMEGAGFLQRVWYITLPQIKNIVITLFLLSVMGAFNTMEGVLVYTGGGPGGTTETMLLYAYKQAINSMDYSYAITMATIVFFLTFVLTATLTKFTNKEN